MRVIRIIFSIFCLIGTVTALTNNDYSILNNVNTLNSVSLEWSTAVPVSYTFKLTDTSTSQLINQIEDTKFTIGNKQITIGNLQPNKEYTIELTANSIDNGPFTYKKTVQTNTKKPNAT